MPGQDRTVERPYAADELVALGQTVQALGTTTVDIYLNDGAYWRNVPPPSGTISPMATKCSKRGCLTLSTACWAGR